jgi:ArsR family transcriptional regulator
MAIPQNDELNLLHTNICKALADTKRIQMLYVLAEGPHNVTALTERLELPQSTVSRHLAILRQRALVSCERDGTTITYHLADPRIIEVLDQMRAILRDILARQAGTMNPIPEA